MSFRDFTLPKVQQDFGLTADATRQLFAGVAPVPLSETLRRYLDDMTVRLLRILEENTTAEDDQEALMGMEAHGFAQWAALDSTLAGIAGALSHRQR